MAQHIKLRYLLVCSVLVVMSACGRQPADSSGDPASDNTNPNDGSDAVETKDDSSIDEAGDGVAAKYQDVPNGEPVIHHALTGELEDDGWCVAESTRGNFQIDMPGKYFDHMIKSTGTSGTPGGVMHTVGTITEEGVEFSVLQTEPFGPMPEGDLIQKMADDFRSKEVDVTLSDMTIDGRPGRKLVGVHSTIAAELAFVTVGNNHYMIGVQFEPQLHEQMRDDIDRFHGSFTIVDSDQ